MALTFLPSFFLSFPGTSVPDMLSAVIVAKQGFGDQVSPNQLLRNQFLRSLP